MTTLDRIQALADLTLALGEVNRATQHPDGRAETDTTHTVMLSLIAADLAPDEGVEVADAVLFALVHDLAEAYAGDTNTARALNPEQAQAKAEREAAALARIRQDLTASPWIVAAIDAYERQEDPACRFVRYLDKIMPKLTHRRNGCAAVKAIGMTVQDVRENHVKQGIALRTQYPEFPTLDALFWDACTAAEIAYLKGAE